MLKFNKIFAFALFASLTLTASSVALAQGVDEADNEEVQVTADVSVPIRVTRLSDLDLGNLRRGESKMVTADGAGFGEVAVIGDAGEDIQLTYPMAPAVVTLQHTDDDDGATLSVKLVCKTSYTRGGGGTNYVSGTGVELSEDGAGDAMMDGDGQRYFRFGGSVTASNNQSRGHYNGSFDVHADYYP